MDQVQIGLMLPGAKPFNDQNVNPTWKAHIRIDQETKSGFVKEVEPRSLYIECVCAVVGRLLDLPIPKPIIVKITHDSLPHIAEGGYVLGFGSEDAGYPSFRRYASLPQSLDKLSVFPKTLDVAVFDEWIANYDRNVGNILYDGGDKFSFIDHEASIGKGLKVDDPAKDNQLVRCLYKGLSEFEKHKIFKEAQDIMVPDYNDIPLSLVSERTYGTSYLNENEIVEVIDFLSKRINHMSSLLRQRLNMQQQGLAI